jgi:uncharacterized protein
VDKLADLEPGMILEGVVTNVAAFGAFVDVGVHQDGLVHISAMSRNFVKDPRDVVKPGDIVRVKVQDVDIPRKRISLTLRLDDETGEGRDGGRREGRDNGGRDGGREGRDNGGREGRRDGRDNGGREGRRDGRAGGRGEQRSSSGGSNRTRGGGPAGGRGGSGGSGGGALADALRRAGLDKGLDQAFDKRRR